MACSLAIRKAAKLLELYCQEGKFSVAVPDLASTLMVEAALLDLGVSVERDSVRDTLWVTCNCHSG